MMASFKKISFLFFFLVILPSFVHADESCKEKKEKPVVCCPKCLMVQIEAGIYASSPGRGQFIGIQDLVGDYFSIYHKNKWNYLLGAGVFIDGYDYAHYHLLYGINVFYLNNISVTGNITQENLFTNLKYRYQVTHYPLYAMGKIVINTRNEKLDIIVDAGIGPNFLQTTDFGEHSLDHGVTLPEKAFRGQTQVVFSATLGAAFRINDVFPDCIPLEIGYRFFYLGQGELKKRSNQILNNLKTDTIYANALVASVYF